MKKDSEFINIPNSVYEIVIEKINSGVEKSEIKSMLITFYGKFFNDEQAEKFIENIRNKLSGEKPKAGKHGEAKGCFIIWGIILVLVILLITMIIRCERNPSETITRTKKTTITTESYTVEYKMAVIDNGYLNQDDPVIQNYKILLDSLNLKTGKNIKNIADITVTVQNELKEKGVYISLLRILGDLNNAIIAAKSTMTLEEVAATYIVLMSQ